MRCAYCWARRGVSHVPGSDRYELRKAQAKRNLSHNGRNHCTTIHLIQRIPYTSIPSCMMFVYDGHCRASSAREALWFSISLDWLCHSRCLDTRPDRRQVPLNGNLHVRSAGNTENLKRRALVTVDVSVFSLTQRWGQQHASPDFLCTVHTVCILHGRAAITSLTH